MTITMRALAATVCGVGLTVSAHAVHLDPGGRGQVLLYPYYTVNNHQQTLLSVTNTSAAAQALKVRFREGYNSRPVLEFNLWLPPFDVWTGTVFALQDAALPGAGAAILSADSSCTSPQFSDSGTMLASRPFITFANSAYAGAFDDGGPTATSRTREGWIEIIAMTDVTEPLRTAITHTATGGTPANCLAVKADSIVGTAAVSNRPSGGLIGAASIINVGQGTLLATRAEPLAGFTAVALFTGPGNSLPNLASVNDTVPGGVATAHRFDNDGRMLELSYGGSGVTGSRPVDAVSAVLMADTVYNEFVISPQLNAGADWILTFPTKHFYVDVPLAGNEARPPFEELFSENQNGTSATSATRSAFNRASEEIPQPAECGFLCPPGPTPMPKISYAVNTMLMGRNYPSESTVLYSNLTAFNLDFFTTVPLRFDAGWIRVNLDPYRVYSPLAGYNLVPSVEGRVLRGLPVIGFWATNLVNNNVSAGVLSNYSAAVRHATSVTCVKASDGTTCD